MAIGFISLHAQTFVHPNAMGNNDGSSWENAYNSLQTAIDNTPNGNIWVANGTYYPGEGMPDSTSTFLISQPVHLYGGFAGTETSVEERDLEAHPSILSGDLANNDIPLNFEMNKDDNVLHVITIDTFLNGQVTIDGFRIRGGQTLEDNDLESPYLLAGGGILSFSTFTLRNCQFNNNFANSGGAVFVEVPNGEGMVMQNCFFQENSADAQGCAVHLRTLNGALVEDCVFIQNVGFRGTFYPLNCTDLVVRNSIFSENLNPDGFGGAFFNWNSVNTRLEGCTFSTNVAENGGAIYNDGRNVDVPILIVDGCTFEDNVATDFGGGAIYNWNSVDLSISNSTFTGNIGANAGAIYNDGRNITARNLIVSNTTFTENRGNGFGGGAVYNWESDCIISHCDFNENFGANAGGAIYNAGITTLAISDCSFRDNEANFAAGMANYSTGLVTVERCNFSENIAITSGAASFCAFLANVDFVDCHFEENVAQWGGAVYLQSDTTQVRFQRCGFLLNEATNFGGAINVFSGVNLTVDSCQFEGNSANFGGAISMIEDSLDLAVLSMKNSTFLLNFSDTQAGAINFINTDATIENCLFANNSALDVGTGGAISNNATMGNTASVAIINSTVANNFGNLAAGIAQWTEEGGEAILTLQNNIFSNLGLNYAIEDGSPIVISNGGNLSTDDSFGGTLDNTNDLVGENPLFVDEEEDDFHLQEDSPCINTGITEGAPVTDLEGNPRVGVTDKGAYEFQNMVAVEEVNEETDNTLSIFPNPVLDKAVLRLENEWRGELEVLIINQLGQVAQKRTIFKNEAILEYELLFEQFIRGIYMIEIQNRNQKILERVVKI